jgi:hypothetical protein
MRAPSKQLGCEFRNRISRRRVRAEMGGTQLISYRGSGQTSCSTWYHDADWLDFNTIQSVHNFGSDSYAFVSKD